MEIVALVAVLGFGALAIVSGFGAFAIGAAVYGAGYGLYKLKQHVQRTHANNEWMRSKQESVWQTYRDSTSANREAARRPVLTPEQFLDELAAALRACLAGRPRPRPEKLIGKCLALALNTYTSIRPTIVVPEAPPEPYPLPTAIPPDFEQYAQAIQDAANHRHAFNEPEIIAAFVECFGSLCSLDALYDQTGGQFNVPLYEIASNLPNLITSAVHPFSLYAFHSTSLWVPYITTAKRLGRKPDDPLWPSNFEGSKQDLIDTYLQGNPLRELFEIPIAYNLSDETRFEHHHVMGNSGRGKTTYLNHLIGHDLDRVADGKCSLIVMDSKKLIRQMSRLKWFAPGGPLHNRLILIDADPAYPVALNPFQMGATRSEEDRINNAVDVISYAISGTTDKGATDLQEGAMEWIIKYAAHKPDANLTTLRDMFAYTEKGQVPFPELFDMVDSDLQFYMANVFDKLQLATKQGIMQRLMKLINNNAIKRMFNAPECKVDLYEELSQGGKVLLVNTAFGKQNAAQTELLGRVIIALIENMANRRQELDDPNLPPVHCFIDEAGDYIRFDERFPRILTKARSARVSMTIAHQQWSGQVDTSYTREALEGVKCRAKCRQRGFVEFELGDRDIATHLTLVTKRFEWPEDFLQMSDAEYHDMRQAIFAKYGPDNSSMGVASSPPLSDDPAATR